VCACALEEIALYQLQEISALWVVVIAEVGKRLDVRMIDGFVALLVPTGVLPCTISPLVDAALYHRQYNGYGSDWNRREVFVVDNAVTILVLEPQRVDSLLDDGVSIWVTGVPSKVGFLSRV